MARRTATAWIVAASTLLLGCSGDEASTTETVASDATVPTTPSTSAPGTTAEALVTTAPATAVSSTIDSTTTTTTATTAVAPVTTSGTATTVAFDEPWVIARSLGNFIILFNQRNQALAGEFDEVLELSRDQIEIDEIPTLGTGFIADDLFEAGILGGTLSGDGEIVSLYLFFDPDGPTAAPALLASLFAAIAGGVAPELEDFVDAYVPLASDAANRAGEHAWLPGPDFSSYSLTISVIEGADPSDNLIEVAIVPVPTEAEALIAAELLRTEVLGMLLS